MVRGIGQKQASALQTLPGHNKTLVNHVASNVLEKQLLSLLRTCGSEVETSKRLQRLHTRVYTRTESLRNEVGRLLGMHVAHLKDQTKGMSEAKKIRTAKA